MAGQRLSSRISRAALKFWKIVPDADVRLEKPPDLINNEYLESINAAGTGVVALIKAGTSDSVRIASDRIIIHEKTIADAGTNIFDVALPTLTAFGGLLLWSIHAADGTDAQSFSGVSTIAAVNKGGVYTSQVTELAGIQAKAVSSGTLTEAVTIVTGTNKITVKFTPTGSLTETTYRLSFVLINNSRQAVTLL